MKRFIFSVLAFLAMTVPVLSQGVPQPPPPTGVLQGQVLLSVSNSSSRVALAAPANAGGAITIYNKGAVDAYFALGGSSVTATTGGTCAAGISGPSCLIAAGTAITVWNVGSYTYIAAITSSSTTTLLVYQGSGPVQLSKANTSAVPSGAAGGDLSGTYPDPTVVGGSHITNGSIANSGLANSSVTIAGHSVSLGGTQTIACADLSDGTTNCSAAVGQLPGTATNDDAAAGKVGQFISATTAAASPVSLTTGTPADIASISLTAGDWDVWATAGFNLDATTSLTQIIAWISATSATIPTTPNSGAYVQDNMTAYVPGGVTNDTYAVGIRRFSVASTTTIYLSVRGTFSASTLTGFGFIGARRVR